LEAGEPVLATSRIALVQVTRATRIANPSPEVRTETERLLDSCLLVNATDTILRAAAGLTSREVRSVDAIHLAIAKWLAADEMLAYDRRLRDAALAVGFPVTHPGASG
jgi:predicted nucleic acid-binding protein